jgi:hypothetical protein
VDLTREPARDLSRSVGGLLFARASRSRSAGSVKEYPAGLPTGDAAG